MNNAALYYLVWRQKYSQYICSYSSRFIASLKEVGLFSVRVFADTTWLLSTNGTNSDNLTSTSQLNKSLSQFNPRKKISL